MVAELGRRADAIRSGSVDPASDNMLVVTNDGRKLALDQRLVIPDLPDGTGRRLRGRAEDLGHMEGQRTGARRPDRVLRPEHPEARGFNVYDDLRGKLVDMGIPAGR